MKVQLCREHSACVIFLDEREVHVSSGDIGRANALLIEERQRQRGPARPLKPHEVNKWDVDAIVANFDDLKTGVKILADPYLPVM